MLKREMAAIIARTVFLLHIQVSLHLIFSLSVSVVGPFQDE